MVAFSNGSFVLAGLVSYGFPCTGTRPIRYGVYTAVKKFNEWIKAKSDYSDCPMSMFVIFTFQSLCLTISSQNIPFSNQQLQTYLKNKSIKGSFCNTSWF